MHISQLQQLKRQKFLLVGDNNELRDLCCYLDDERAKARSVAREWQAFGTHMSRVMRQEVTAYTTKLTELESKQFELVRQNFELKQLCLLLDNAINVRENGDGSTGSTSEEPSDELNGNGGTITAQQRAQRMAVSQQTLEYIRTLEDRIHQLEWEKIHGGQTRSGDHRQNSSVRHQPVDLSSNTDTIESYDTGSSMHTLTKSPSNGQLRCPPAIADAMRVLRIHDSMKNENLPKSGHSSASGTMSLKRPDRKAGSSTGGSARSSRRNSSDNNLEEMSIEEQRSLMRSLGSNWQKQDEDIV